MKAVILAAGVGRRLDMENTPPKVLLRFGGRSLLERHLEILRYCGVERVELAVGHRAKEVEQEVAAVGATGFVRTRLNPDYRRGSIVSLWSLRQAFTRGEPLIFMDGDVLYDYRIMERLIASRHENCFLMDRSIEPGEEPVKLCMRDGRLVDFHKRPQLAHDWHGEWVGFAQFTPEIAARIAVAAERYVDSGRHDEIYEEAFRDVVLREPAGTFDVEDITGLPWVEIDFPEDVRRAEREVFPRLIDLPGGRDPRGGGSP
jgi:choline kinase